MTVAAYSTDLADITASAMTGFAEPTASGWTLGAAPGTPDSENIIQGTLSVPKAFNATGVGGALYGPSSKTISTPQAVFFWICWASPNALETEANGGIRAVIGNALNDFKSWIIRGRDTYITGGWINEAVDPSVTSDYTVTGSAGFQYFGVVVNNTNAITKGSPYVSGPIRYGRTIQVVSGEAGNYGTFVGAAAKNDANDATAGYNRWGLFQEIQGGYLMKGLFLMGTAATAVDFRDANRNIAIQNTKKVAAGFNEFEVRNASSRVDWTAISVTALGTLSKCKFTVTNNAVINKNNCTFTDLDAFIYQSNSTILNSTYRRCGLVTQGGAVFTNCIFESASGAVSIKASNPNVVTGCLFTSDGSNHAMEATTAGDYNWNNTLSGYASSDGSGGNEAFYNNSGGHINLTVVGGTTPKVRNGTNASTTVIIPQVTLTISAQVSLVGAEIRIYDLDNSPAGSLGTELSGTESVSGATYAFSSAASNSIWIQIMKNGYIEFGQQVTMPTTNGSFPATLISEVN